ncbi:MAG: hypothetical protein LBE92_06390 [Chryseobacterium sp.]|jgi:hypothetical protein|uniref:hypothetical protein n=1 Tax=Chryseobacterium sp. TaxID=1871047 RepID=UPI002821B857|nr:hypothetical protein [Chryseobacterium sp.]MDR2235733.1 hypothetical protein [Chryseobacterium sp.]
MQKLKFIYQNWNRAYYKLQSEDDTCWYYGNFYKSKMPKKMLREKTQDVETWAKYAYSANKDFMQRMWQGEFSLKNLDTFNDKVDEIARIFNVTALLEITEQPYAYLDIGGAFATVCFIDEYNRVYMQYSFQNDDISVDNEEFKNRFKNGNLFLVELEVFIYPEEMIDERWQNKDYISYAFTPTGYLEVTKIFDVRGDALTEKYIAESPVNVESNWEPYPEFGKWDSIFRMKRWKEGELAEGIKLPENTDN